VLKHLLTAHPRFDPFREGWITSADLDCLEETSAISTRSILQRVCTGGLKKTVAMENRKIGNNHWDGPFFYALNSDPVMRMPL
jgi:hypothetical protein